MARPKGFDPNVAMKEAMEAFWERGYHATSVSDLLAEMNLNRGSLYDTFGDKKSLFMAALQEYEKQGRANFARFIERPGSVREALRDWLGEVALSCTGDEGRRGCLGLKAALEVAPHDAEVAEWVRRVTRERELLLAKAIRRGQAAGEIDASLDPRVAARFVLASLSGLKVMGTLSPSERELRDLTGMILRVLDGPR